MHNNVVVDDEYTVFISGHLIWLIMLYGLIWLIMLYVKSNWNISQAEEMCLPSTFETLIHS